MKLNQKGAIDMMLVAALVVVLIVGGFVLMRVSSSDDNDTTNKVKTEDVETADQGQADSQNGTQDSDESTSETPPADWSAFSDENSDLSGFLPDYFETSMEISTSTNQSPLGDFRFTNLGLGCVVPSADMTELVIGEAESRDSECLNTASFQDDDIVAAQNRTFYLLNNSDGGGVNHSYATISGDQVYQWSILIHSDAPDDDYSALVDRALDDFVDSLEFVVIPQ